MYLEVFDIHMSYEMLATQLKIISHSTLCDWRNYIRDVYINYFHLNSESIGGNGIIVQIDESQICKRKFHRGRVLVNQKVWLDGGIKTEGKIFQMMTEVRNKSVLDNIIRTQVN